MKKLLLIIMLLSPLGANASVLKGGYAGCITEILFDEMITASINDDYRLMIYLLDHGCIMTKPGIEVSILNRTWNGVVKVRAYLDDISIILWTNKENIIEKIESIKP